MTTLKWRLYHQMLDQDVRTMEHGIRPAANLGQRYWLVELIAYWEGRINTRHLCEQFNLSRQQASKIINQYKQEYPGNLHYCASQKHYAPSPEFSPHHIDGNVTEYLRWLTTPGVATGVAIEKSAVNYEAVAIPPRQVAPELMRGLIAAMRGQRRLDVDYVSLTSPNGEGRVIVPHTFVNTGLRWHLRAWCEKSNDYRDFVLSRFRGTPDLLDKSEHSAVEDTGWNTHITLIFEPDSRFTAAKRDVIMHDYNMVEGQLCVITRAALAHYVIQEMQVNTKFLAETPEEQQLVLVNKADIKQWLFGG